MTVHVHRPWRTGPPASTSSAHPPRREPEDRGWLVLLGAVVIAVLVFGAMVALTALGGGTDYAPWAP